MLTDDDIADAAHALQQERIEDMGGVDTDWFEMMAKAAMMKYRSWDIEKQRAEDAKQRAEAEQPPAPARKPWPTLPVKACKRWSDTFPQWLVETPKIVIAEVPNQIEAEAIALALNWTPRAAAWMRTDRARFPLAQHPGSCLHELDALLAEVDAAGFEL